MRSGLCGGVNAASWIQCRLAGAIDARFQPSREELLDARRPGQGEPHRSAPGFDREIKAEKRTAEPLGLDQRHRRCETVLTRRDLNRVPICQRLDVAYLSPKRFEHRRLSLAKLGFGA